MIVCVCNNVSDKKIQRAVEQGMSTMSELRTHLQVATCCGKCAGCAREVLQECLQTTSREPGGMRGLFQKIHFQPDPVAI